MCICHLSCVPHTTAYLSLNYEASRDEILSRLLFRLSVTAIDVSGCLSGDAEDSGLLECYSTSLD
jgi:hypothetical protein